MGLRPFFSEHYQAHNKARLGHLASLGLPLAGRTVLELGSGPGDHTGFYVGMGCRVTSVDGRPECVATLQERFSEVRAICADLNDPAALDGIGQFEVAHCYGILYHLENPASLIATIGKLCTGLVLLETCVSPGDGDSVPLVEEYGEDFSQSITNQGCRPTREWVFQALKRYFPYVYVTRTQPDHAEFPLDWTVDLTGAGLIRTVFVAAHSELRNPLLADHVLARQERFQDATEHD